MLRRLEIKDCEMARPLRVKDIDTAGRRVILYAAAFGNKDSHGDIILPGAFKKTIAERGPAGTNQIKHLNQHDTWQLVGGPLSLDEDGHGLLADSLIPKTRAGDDVLELEIAGLYEHSIGYQTIKEEVDNEQEVRYLKELFLWEYSSVTWGSNPNTPRVGMKSLSTQEQGNVLLQRMERLQKQLRKGNLMDTTYEMLELEVVQIHQSISELLAKSLPALEPATVSTPEAQEPTEAKVSPLLYLSQQLIHS